IKITTMLAKLGKVLAHV
uniref:Bombolitin-1 n=1 Tax=Bombus pensylvanicus TaxID=28643 RepID=BOL1_BOMPE|nr:RecName: Full=Bombolitin-1; AltName: Full=Bombolitin I [Bombus pensylvanicus]